MFRPLPENNPKLALEIINADIRAAKVATALMSVGGAAVLALFASLLI